MDDRFYCSLRLLNKCYLLSCYVIRVHNTVECTVIICSLHSQKKPALCSLRLLFSIILDPNCRRSWLFARRAHSKIQCNPFHVPESLVIKQYIRNCSPLYGVDLEIRVILND
jgi:hypothetical protein